MMPTDGTIFTNKTKQDLNVSGSGSPYTWKGGTFKSVGKWSVDYLDENGDNQVSTKGLPITASCTTLPAGWYFVEYNTNLNHQLTFTGDAKLILGDKAKLRITDATNTALTVSGNLTIYSQSLGDDMGSLTAESASSTGTNSDIFR